MGESEREHLHFYTYLSIYVRVCVCECYLSIYPQIQTNLTVRSGRSEVSKVAKRKTERNITNFYRSLSLSRNGIEKEFLLEIIAHFAGKELLLPPPPLSLSLPRFLEKLNFFHF